MESEVITKTDVSFIGWLVGGAFSGFLAIFALIKKEISQVKRDTISEVDQKLAQGKLDQTVQFSEMVSINNSHIKSSIERNTSFITEVDRAYRKSVADIDKEIALIGRDSKHLTEKVDRLETMIEDLKESNTQQQSLLTKVYTELTTFIGRSGNV